MGETTCSVPGCDRQAYCRTWCSGHYDRWRAHGDVQADVPIRSHKPIERTKPCVIDSCANMRNYSEHCNMHYLRIRRHGDPNYARPKFEFCTVKDCGNRVEYAANPHCQGHRRKLNRYGSLKRPCQQCGAALPEGATRKRRYCEECAVKRFAVTQRNCEQRRRAQKSGAESEKFSSTDIYERDGWRCGLCRRRVNKRLVWPHPMSASLDHTIPLVHGGPHTRANVKLAHLRCNVRKNAGGGNEQLLLIG